MLEKMASQVDSRRQCYCCHQTFNDDKFRLVSRCKHLCCQACIDRSTAGESPSCPVCQRDLAGDDHDTTDEIASVFNVADLTRKCDDFISMVTDDTPLPLACKDCERAESVTRFCATCRCSPGAYTGHHCLQCSDKHDGHGTVAYRRYEVCLRHDCAVISDYCRDCRRRLCSDCVLRDHLQHDVIDMERADLVAESRCALKEKEAGIKHLHRMYSSAHAVRRDHHDQMTMFDCGGQFLESLRDNIGRDIERTKSLLEARKEEEEARHQSFMEQVESGAQSLQRVLDFIDKSCDINRSPFDMCFAAQELPRFTVNMQPLPPQKCHPIFNRFRPSVDAEMPNLFTLSYIDMFNPCIDKYHEVPNTGDTDAPSLKRKDEGTLSPAETPAKVAATGGRQRGGGRTVRRLPIFNPAEEERVLWETWCSTGVEHILWDTLAKNAADAGWWAKTATDMWHLTTSGFPDMRIPFLDGGYYGGVCLDTRRLLMVLCAGSRGLDTLSTVGAPRRQITFPASEHLEDVTYCAHSDIYVAAQKQQLWVIESESGVVTNVIHATQMSTCLDLPWYICHSAKQCSTFVSEYSGKKVIKIDNSGKIKSFLGEDENIFNEANGICLDDDDRVYACDQGNCAVYRFKEAADGSYPAETILSLKDMKGCDPSCVAVSPDSRYLVVVMSDPDGLIRCYKNSFSWQ